MKLIKYLKPYWLFAVLSPILMVGEVVVDLMQPKLMSRIVDEGILGGDISLIIQTGLLMLGLVILGGASGFLCAVTATYASQSFGHDLRVDTYSRVMGLSLEQTDDFTTGSLVTRLTNDVSMVQDLVSMVLRMFVRAPIFFIGGIIMAVSLNTSFALALAIALPIQLVAVLLLLKKAGPMYGKVQTKLDRVNSVVQENVSGTRVVKAYVREEYENARFGQANGELRDNNYRVLKLMSILNPILMLIMNLTVIAIILIGGYQAEAQAIKPGDIMAAVTYVTQILNSVMMISNMFQSLSRASASSKRIVEVLECAPVIESGKGGEGNDRAEACIEFKHVSFRYPGTTGLPVLSDINLKVGRGETVAVIGATGCGKTSLVNLIPRFYDATEGTVLIDGQPVEDWDLSALRRKIGFVMQKSELFSDTIANNIRWGKPEAAMDEIKAAAATAQAASFIEGFSDDYETFIAEKGASLSGGQKQRMSIARALVRRPEILILDDATSALDLATEAKLQAALREELKDTTVVMIAQRIASVRSADRIAVMEKDGRILHCAPHDELMKISPTYQDIYQSQMKGGEDK